MGAGRRRIARRVGEFESDRTDTGLYYNVMKRRYEFWIGDDGKKRMTTTYNSDPRRIFE